jgi:glycosidase
MAEWLEALGRITLLARESVASLLTFLAAMAITCSTADGAAPPPPAGPAWAWNLPVYETALDFAMPHGTFREFEQRLDALHHLGVGIIWFLPIFPTGGNPPDKPRSDSPYCVWDYHDVNPRYGTKEEFMHLDKSEYEFLQKTPLPAKYKGGDRAFAVLCATLPNSKPMVWNGQELGILSSTPKLQWNDSPYLEFYRKLLHAYRLNPALYEGEFHQISTSNPKAVYAFWRRAGQNRAVVVVNLTDQPQQVTLELGESAGHYAEVFTAEDRMLAVQAKLDLEPWAYRVYLDNASQRLGRSGKP